MSTRASVASLLALAGMSGGGRLPSGLNFFPADRDGDGGGGGGGDDDGAAQLRQLRTRRDNLVTQRTDAIKAGRAILNAVAADKPLTDEQRKASDGHLTMAEGLSEQIKTVERQIALEEAEDRSSGSRTRNGDGNGPGGRRRSPRREGETRTRYVGRDRRTSISDEDREVDERECRAYTNYLRFGVQGLDAEDRDILNDGGFRNDLTNQDRKELRSLGISTDAGGGYTVPDGFYNQMQTQEAFWGGMMEAGCEEINSETGNDLPIPTNDDTGNEGAIVAEDAAAGEQDTVFGNKILKSYLYTSKLVRVSNQLLNDSAFDMQGYLTERFGERLGRIKNRHFTVGTGGGAQPEGIVPNATLGVTAAGVAAITYDELIELYYSVNRAHRSKGVWMGSDEVAKLLSKLKDSDGRPLLQQHNTSAQEAGGDIFTIFGKRFVPNSNMTAPATGVKSLLFGNPRAYKIRNIGRPVVLRFNERYGEYFQTGFVAFSRHDGALVKPSGTAALSPVRYLVQA